MARRRVIKQITASITRCILVMNLKICFKFWICKMWNEINLENKLSLTIDLKHFKSTGFFLCCLVSLLLNKKPNCVSDLCRPPKCQNVEKDSRISTKMQMTSPEVQKRTEGSSCWRSCLFSFWSEVPSCWYLITFNRKMNGQMVQVYNLYTLSWFLNDIQRSQNKCPPLIFTNMFVTFHLFNLYLFSLIYSNFSLCRKYSVHLNSTVWYFLR